MERNKKRIDINSDLIILLCLGVLCCFFLICSRVSMNLFGSEAGECLSVALFGKLELKHVDKIVLRTVEQEIIITDAALIDEVVSETAIATHTQLCGCEADISIELFRGDKCVRSMEWEIGHNTVKVYETDISHWILIPLGKQNGGYVYLSDGLSSRLNGVIASYTNH